METTRIEKRIGVQADKDRLWDLVGDLQAWSRWNRVETDLAGVIAYGGELSFTEAIPDLKPRAATARVVEWTPYQQLVWSEARGLWFGSMRYFEIEELAPGRCIAANGFIFSGLRGEMFFDRHRAALRRAADAVGEAWKAAAEA